MSKTAVEPTPAQPQWARACRDQYRPGPSRESRLRFDQPREETKRRENSTDVVFDPTPGLIPGWPGPVVRIRVIADTRLPRLSWTTPGPRRDAVALDGGPPRGEEATWSTSSKPTIS